MTARRASSARRLLGLSRNYVSLVGTALAFAGALCIAFLFLIELRSGRDNPYLGIFTYLIFPAVLSFGLLVVLAGMLWERRRRRRSAPSEVPAYPILDLNDPRRRRSFIGFVGFVVVFVLLSAFGSYRAYDYSESVVFCGQVCHTPMKPEFTAFQVSPHARIRCVDCHVGAGAEWYLRSKLSGAYQLYALAFDAYPRPIPTPVHNMRPARDTCEQCHWPEKFYGAQLKVFDHYGYDETNTPTRTRMLVNTGGGSAETGMATGIHWHMSIANEITYASTDGKRQAIPWVRLKDASGNVTEYTLAGERPTPEQLASATQRRMDCIDCHSRPSHAYVPPDRAVDGALAAGRLDASLPYLKRQAVEALSRPYGSNEEALDSIGAALDGFYRASYPDLYAAKRESVDHAVAETRRIYETYFFPEMKVDWQTHPDNVGHYYFQGCFRCHDGRHVSDTGKVIRNECAVCHTVLDQTVGGAAVAPPDGEFRHPVDLGDKSKLTCSVCHMGDRPFRHPLDLGDLSEFKCSECHPGSAEPGT